MMHLCSNRPEGFGPMSRLYPHHVTSCFADVILVPLATWIFLFFFAVALVLGRSKYQSYNNNNGTTKPPRPNRVLTIFYSFFIIAALAMTALEIARLVAQHLGIGLLPFTFVGIILAAALHYSDGLRGRIPSWPMLNAAYWLLLLIFLAVKISEETEEGNNARKGSMYPESDEIIDVATMIGVYGVLAIFELLSLMGMRRQMKKNNLDRGRAGKVDQDGLKQGAV